MIAKVLVDVKSKNVDKMYDYQIPEKYIGILQVGARVIVPFGHRKVMGFCLDIVNTSDYVNELKAIEGLIDIESYLTEDLIEIAKQLREESGYLLIQVLETILPSALKAMYQPKLEIIDQSRMDSTLIQIFDGCDEIPLNQIDSVHYDLIKRAIKEKIIRQVYDVKKRNRSLSKRYVKLIQKEPIKMTEKHQLVYDFLTQKKQKEEKLKHLLSQLNITQSVIKTMEKNQVVKLYDKEVYRKVETLYQGNHLDVVLNQEQAKVYQEIVNHFGQFHTVLLHGVTGSGKTEIYMKLIEQVVLKDQSAILLVPEISLTPMMIQRFKNRYGDQVAALHSGLSTMEKYDEWRRIIKQEAKIVIGARSACFAPLNDIGLMIVDECHETTYKQSDNLPYYAIDVLKKRGFNHQSVLVLGSATPNIESYARSQKGYYQLSELKQRALNSLPPKVKVISMLEEFKAGRTDDISLELLNAIKDRINQNQQVILLINRRGYANFMICRSCGHVKKCPNCDISLTYHQSNDALMCHYCGHQERKIDVCDKCQSKDLELMGSGTQKAEEQLKMHFPTAKIYRMDTDTTSKKHAHEKLLHQFQNDGDILLGTQMIAKGLDFPRVTLVGVLQADSNLYVPDFRAPEKTFQLMMQVSGRSGRRDTLGEVYIQAFNPDHYAIKYACNNDYLGFYKHEMMLRRIARYEPFFYLVQLDLTGISINQVMYFGMQMVKELRRGLSRGAIILGPSSDIKKIKNRYTTSILIKYKEEPDLNRILYGLMNQNSDSDVLIRIDRFPGVG